MRMTTTSALFALLAALPAAQASAQPVRLARLYQGRNAPEQTESVSRKVKLGRDGRVSVSNVSGDITVTSGSGDEVTIDAVKRGSRSAFDRVRIVIEDRPGRVDISTDYGFGSRFGAGNNVSVDYTITMPAGASLDAHSVSGRVNVKGIKGSARVGTVSGTVTTSMTPRIEGARTVSGEIDLSDIAHDDNLSIGSVSGSIRLNGVKVRALDISTVSGDVRMRDAACERLTARSVSGAFEYAGTLARNGRYDVNSHSGEVRFALGDNTGFELDATSFSGSIRSDYQMTVGGQKDPNIRRGRGPGNESMHATFGDGSASLTLRTFSGNIVIAKR